MAYTQEIEISKEFYTEVWCSCGNGICREAKWDIDNDCIIVTVEPCEKCIKEAYENGLEDGKE